MDRLTLEQEKDYRKQLHSNTWNHQKCLLLLSISIQVEYLLEHAKPIVINVRAGYLVAILGQQSNFNIA